MGETKLLSLAIMLVGGILLAVLDLDNMVVMLGCVGLILIGAITFLGGDSKKAPSKRKR